MDNVTIVFLIIYSVLALANVVLTIWYFELKRKYQEEDNVCTYALYRKLKRYNDNYENRKS